MLRAFEVNGSDYSKVKNRTEVSGVSSFVNPSEGAMLGKQPISSLDRAPGTTSSIHRALAISRAGYGSSE